MPCPKCGVRARLYGRCLACGHEGDRLVIPMPPKTCCKCGQAKPRHEYNANRARLDGLRSRCRECQRRTAPTRRPPPRPLAGPTAAPSP